MTIVVATKNNVKINAIKEALVNDNEYTSVLTAKVDSGVPEQPINEQVYNGANNRLEEAKKLAIEKNKKYDYVVSCEGGLIEQFGKWFNVQVVLIENQDGIQSYGISQGYQIPNEYVDEIINTDLATVLDKNFDKKGGIRHLSKGKIESRGELVKNATIMAYSGLNWEIEKNKANNKKTQIEK